MLDLLRPRKEELVCFVIVSFVFIFLNVLYVNKFLGIYWPMMSGYDPLVKTTISDWTMSPYLNRYVATHPLFALFLFPLYVVNRLVSEFAGFNCVDFICAVALTVFASYTFIILRRIFSEILILSKYDSLILTILTYSFAYGMLMAIVPEHFPFSMSFLVVFLYLTGLYIKEERKIPAKVVAYFYLIITGITITNGFKVILSVFFQNHKIVNNSYFKRILLILSISTIFILFVAAFELKFCNGNEQHYQMAEAYTTSVAAIGHTPTIDALSKKHANLDDSVNIKKQYTAISHRQDIISKEGTILGNIILLFERYKVWSEQNNSLKSVAVIVFFDMFGEVTQFHQTNMLEDGYTYFFYDSPINHFVLLLTICIFAFGAWRGRKSKFIQICLSWFTFDLFLHLICQIGQNEIYIFSPHWIFIIPICIGNLFTNSKIRPVIRVLLTSLTFFYLVWNGGLLYSYLS